MLGKVYDKLRVLTPYPARQWIKRQPWFMPLAQRVFGPQVYSDSYYSDVERIEAESMPHIAQWICDHFEPKRIIDVGCGPGHLMKQLADRGVNVFGVDISDEALRHTRAKGLPIERFDLTTSTRPLPGGPYDLAISCEVAEHLEEEHAATFVRTLTGAAERVYITAAEPSPDGHVGMFHFNEQPHGWWIDLFDKHGYDHDADASAAAQKELHAKNVISYLAKPLIFHKR